MKKVLIILALALLVILPLTAGGNKEAANPDTLRVLLSEEPATGDAFTATLNKWAEETGKTLDIMVIPYDDQLTKFPLMARNHDLPDLIATTRLTRLYPEEFLDLTEYVNIDDFEEQAVMIIGQDYTTNKNYCLPYQFTITNVFYNKDAFERAGITPPTVDDPWTLEEYRENAQILQEKGGVKYGMAMDNSRARYDNVMYMFGGSMVEKNGDSFSVAINSPEAIAALDMFVEWNNSVMPKAIWAGGTTDNPGDYFQNGDVGIYFSGTWNYNTFYQNIDGFEWGVMPSPVGPEGRSAILGGAGLAIPAEAGNKELAIEFIQWFYGNPENFQYFLDRDKGLSSLKNVSYSPEDPQVVEDYQIMQAEVANVTEAFNIDESSSWRNYYDNEYRDALHQAVNGDMSAEEALTDFAEALSEKSGWPMAY